jgi:hypothetical protein
VSRAGQCGGSDPRSRAVQIERQAARCLDRKRFSAADARIAQVFRQGSQELLDWLAVRVGKHHGLATGDGHARVSCGCPYHSATQSQRLRTRLLGSGRGALGGSVVHHDDLVSLTRQCLTVSARTQRSMVADAWYSGATTEICGAASYLAVIPGYVAPRSRRATHTSVRSHCPELEHTEDSAAIAGAGLLVYHWAWRLKPDRQPYQLCTNRYQSVAQVRLPPPRVCTRLDVN